MRLALKRVQGTGRDVMFSNYSKLKDYNVNRNQLWNSILQQAISGKLVPQVDSDPEVEQVGPAPQPDEVPFELPSKWKWVPLGSLCDQSFSGGTPSKTHPEYWGGDIPWASIKDLSAAASFELWSTKDRITKEGLQESSSKVVAANNVIVGMRMGLDKVVINKIPVAINQDLRALYLNRSLIEPDYFVSFYRTLKFEGAGTTVKGIRASQLLATLVPLPPLEEQRRIVARLAEVLLLVERFGEAQEQLVKLEAEFPSKLKASILQQAIKGELVPQLDTEPEVEQVGPAPQPDEVPFELPTKWKWVQLYAVAEYNPEVDANDDLEVSFVPLEKLSWAYDWEPTFDQTKAWGTVKKGYKRFKDGDVIFAKITPSFHNRKSGLVTKACNGIGCGSTEFCVYRCQEQLLNKFLLWFFKSSYFINFGKRTYKGTAGQLRVNLDVINSMYLPLPPIEEQRRIVAKLDEVFTGVEKLGSLMEYA